nr:aminodeoxychorismate synthase component I [Wenzhouxiangella sp. AB-CW3]
MPSDTSLLALHHRWPDRWPFLLASSARAGALGRWSMLLRANAETLTLWPDERGLQGPGEGDRFLERLNSWSERYPGEGIDGLPFCGGWFVYLGYELAGEIEPGLALPPAGDGLPVALARRCPAALLKDHLRDETWLVAEDAESLEAARADVATAPRSINQLPVPDLRVTADAGERFTEGVRRIREWILDGDVFQVNLSRAWQGQSDHPIDPLALYQALAQANPAPFAALARLPGGTVLSSSPERLVEVRDGQVQTRPIAGTRPRGTSAGLDESLSRELVSHPKERAEHIMLIDLERNDLGRVCRPGSVEVDELMVIESYAHVHHIVSNVRGELSPGLGAADAIAAVFPGGTITGCPKVRCMEIISELEQRGRSFYTGSLGYLGRDGSLDLNILIRSMHVNGQSLSFRTGAGIVADSDPEAELAETVAKAKGLLRALGHD